MKSVFGFTLGIVLLLCMSIGASAATTLIRMTDKAPLALGQVVEDVVKSDITFIGDTHDDRDLHAKQLEILRALYARNPQMAIGLEMFTEDNQQYLDYWTAGKVEEKQFIPIYQRNWSYDWSLYRDIFIFARDNHLPMIALNVPKQVIAKVVRQGEKAITEDERKELPPGPWTLNPRQADYLRRIRQQVFGRTPQGFPVANFDEAQALRNDTFAYRISRFRQNFPKRKIVVIAGTWHAIKNGAPESLKKFGNFSSNVLLPDLAEFAWLRPTAEDIDYLIPRGQ